MREGLEVAEEVAHLGELVLFKVELQQSLKTPEFNRETCQLVSLGIKDFKVAEVLNGVRQFSNLIACYSKLYEGVCLA